MNLVLSSVRLTALSMVGVSSFVVALTLVLGVLFPHRAGGSLVVRDGVVVGSELIGQAFVSERYLHGRPSAAGYDPRVAAGSNLGASSPALRARIAADAEALAAAEHTFERQLPADALAASGSGVDPHVSPEHAELQVARVARARGLDPAEVRAVIASRTEDGLLGHARVNVLSVNLALDALPGRP